MGPVANYKQRFGLRLGKGAKRFMEEMTPYGMKITFMDAPAEPLRPPRCSAAFFHEKGFVTLFWKCWLPATATELRMTYWLPSGRRWTAGPDAGVINGPRCPGVIHSARRETRDG